MTAPGGAPRSPAAPSPEVVGFAALAVLIGLVARLRAAAMPAAEMFRSFPSEDGYLMLTVARNLALGKGMASAAGTLPTNGVQPLATFLQAACFRLVGGDREAGVRLLIVVYTVVALGAAWLVYRLGRRLLAGAEHERAASLLAAAVWFASPVELLHTMNMLESGLYAALVAAVALAFARGHAGAEAAWPWRRCLCMGALLGVAFWARNDAVFLMSAVALAHLATAPRTGLTRRAKEVLAMAAAALAVSLPWLVHNVRAFGGLVPVSGRAYLHTGNVGAAARAAAVALWEHAILVVSFEFHPLQHRAPFVFACLAAVVLAAAAIARGVVRASPARRALLALPLAYAAGLLVFYVFFFDAPHFLRRYLFPLSPFLAIAWGHAAGRVWFRAASLRLRPAGALALLVLLANFVIRDGLFVRGPWRQDALFRGVDWVAGHLSGQTWVGAFQSGTLGFFHDRTINLDGKLNPAALAAIRQRRLGAYVVDSPIEFVVDWTSIVEPWARADGAVAPNFEWVVRDRPGNFAVLGRRGAARRPGGGG